MDSRDIAAQFKNLSETAVALNKSSDELTSAVGVLGAALQKLNIGISAWVTFADWTDEQGLYGSRDQIGYDKVDGKWGIALRRVTWDRDRDDDDVQGPWSFTDAPREMRLRSVGHLPALLQELSKQAADTVKKVQEKTEQTRTLVEAIKGATESPAKAYTIKSKNMSAVQVSKIMAWLLKMAPSVNELLRESSLWELDKGTLKIVIPMEKAETRDKLQQGGVAVIEEAARAVMNAPIKVCFFPDLGDWGKVMASVVRS